MIIRTIPSGPLDTNTYIAACERTHEAVILDPALGSAETVVAQLEEHQLTPTQILLTHSHWDHIADVAELVEKWHLPVWIHSADAENLRDPGSDGIPLGMAILPAVPTGFLTEGQEISLGDHTLRVIHTPGHSPGGVCFYDSKQGILFSGDTLFKGSIGNLSSPTGDPEAMWRSLEKLQRLPGETRVYPGHGPSTSLKAENWLPRARQLFGYG